MQNQVLDMSFFTLTILLWFIFGNNYSKKLHSFDMSKFLLFIFINFMPILIYLIAYNVLINISLNAQTHNWILYYSIGAPIIFWIKPASFLLNYFDIDFYLFAYMILALLMIVCFLGLLSSSRGHKTKTTHNYKINKETSRFAAEAAAAVNDEYNCKDYINDANNVFETDELSDQVSFDNLQVIDNEFYVDSEKTLDNSGIKKHTGKDKKRKIKKEI